MLFLFSYMWKKRLKRKCNLFKNTQKEMTKLGFFLKNIFKDFIYSRKTQRERTSMEPSAGLDPTTMRS